MYWIQYFNSIAPNGYNMTLGGEGSIKIDRKQVYSYWDSGLSIPQISKIMHCSIDGVKNILLSYNNFSKEENNKRVIQSTQKEVGQYDKTTGKLLHIFPSIKDAALSVNVDRSCISRCCNGQKKSSRGYYWHFINRKENLDG